MNNLLKYFVGITIGVLLLCLYLFLPAHKASSKAKIAACRSNLNKIGIALFAYSADYDDDYPPFNGDLGLTILLEKGYLSSKKTLECPESKNKTLISYHYKGGFNLHKNKRDIPVCWDKENNHINHINVLFSDGSVKTFNKDKFQKQIKNYLKTSVSNP
jgi:prepilin-type processing-associated H-X9-DG protein